MVESIPAMPRIYTAVAYKLGLQTRLVEGQCPVSGFYTATETCAGHVINRHQALGAPSAEKRTYTGSTPAISTFQGMLVGKHFLLLELARPALLRFLTLSLLLPHFVVN